MTTPRERIQAAVDCGQFPGSVTELLDLVSKSRAEPPGYYVSCRALGVCRLYACVGLRDDTSHRTVLVPAVENGSTYSPVNGIVKYALMVFPDGSALEVSLASTFNVAGGDTITFGPVDFKVSDDV